MKLRTVFVAGLTSVAMVVGGAGTASANVAWCSGDPPVQVDTESGANLTVNVSVSVPKTQVGYLNQVTSTATTVANGAGESLITVHVNIPAGVTSAQVVASVKRYHVTATASGAGGEVVTLYLTVPVD